MAVGLRLDFGMGGTSQLVGATRDVQSPIYEALIERLRASYVRLLTAFPPILSAVNKGEMLPKILSCLLGII